MHLIAVVKQPHIIRRCAVDYSAGLMVQYKFTAGLRPFTGADTFTLRGDIQLQN